jgi:hypothetical protein
VVNAVDFKPDEREIEDLKNLIRFQAHLYNTLFDKAIPDSLPVTINLYKKSSHFKEAAAAESQQLVNMHILGFYSVRSQQCFVYKSDTYQTTIMHEASHRFVHYHDKLFTRPGNFALNKPVLPKWMDEGFAEFFEGLYVDEKKAVHVEAQNGRLNLVKDLIKQDKLQLAAFMSPAYNAAWYNNKGQEGMYSVAYSIIHFIVAAMPNSMAQLISHLQQGKSSYDAFALTFGSFENFESKYRFYYR